MTELQKGKLDDLVQQIHKQGFSSICFWLPTRSVGGGTFLFCELCDYLIKNTDLTVYYVDCPDGYAHSLLENNTQINIINYDPEEKEFPIKEPLLVFTNTTRIIQIKNLNPRSKFVFWHWETNPVGWNSLFLLNETNRYAKEIIKNKAVVFHDWSSYSMFEKQLHVPILTPNYFPVFLPHALSEKQGHKIISEREINIAWVGRLSHDKVNSLNNIITCFAKYKTEKIKRFHIVGDGLCAKTVYEHAKKYYNQMEFIFTGTIPHEELGEYLEKKIDVLFAMGTAILDGAALSLPSVVVTLSEKPFYDDDFYFLPNTKDYCVGITTSQKKDFKVQYIKFNEIINRIISGEKEAIGRNCYRFFIKNYCSYYDRAYSLLSFFIHSTFTMKKLKQIFKCIPYNQIQVKSYLFKNRNILSFVRFYSKCKIILFNRICVLGFNSKKREEPYYKKKKLGCAVSVKNGYIFAAEKFKG